jgi:hypothetical protein
MESLLIQPTEDSPAISFDTKTNKFIISGKSRPENTAKFFSTVFTWFDNFRKKLESQKANAADKYLFIFKLEYFNSVSSKYIADIIFLLKEISDAGHNIVVEWHYPKSDDDMLDIGKEFADMAELNFHFIAD